MNLDVGLMMDDGLMMEPAKMIKELNNNSL